jgi:N-acetylglutamate synthase-like GNAT family acetyltransferase
MSTQIKPYTKQDRLGCLVAFKSNVPKYFTNQEVFDFEDFLTRLDNEDFNTKFYVIHYHDKIIGCGGFGDRHNDGKITLAWGLVHRDFHKKDYGKLLLLHRLEQIKQLNLNLPIVVDTTQYSFGFFEKHGFKTTKITKDFYEKGMHRYDMVFEE